MAQQKKSNRKENDRIGVAVRVAGKKPPDRGPGVTAVQLLTCAIGGSTPPSELFVLLPAGDILR